MRLVETLPPRSRLTRRRGPANNEAGVKGPVRLLPMLIRTPRRSFLLLSSLVALAGCRREAGESDQTFPRDQTVYVGGFQWGPPSSFNPLATAPDWPCMVGNAHNLFY